MLKILLNNKLQIFLVLFFVTFLAIVRAFEDTLFYDPFLNYFKTNYQNLPFPLVSDFQLLVGLTFRYFLNTILSIAIIFLVFKDLEITKFASILYILFFVILIVLFFMTLHIFGEANKMALFYIRRFLIQPLFLILFVPAFYFQKKVSK